MLNIDTDSLGLATNWFRPSLMQRPHRHNEVEINFLEAGSMTYLFGGTRIRVTTGQLALFWATIPHQVVQVEDSAILHWLTIPFATFLRWRLPDILTQRVIRGNFASGTTRPEGQSYQQQFRQWYNDLQQPTPELRKIVALEVEACLWRLSLSLSHSPTTSPATPQPATAEAFAHSEQTPIHGAQTGFSLRATAQHPPQLPISSAEETNQLPADSSTGALPPAYVSADISTLPDERNGAEQPEDVVSSSELSPVERMASFIAEHYTETLPITQIAHEVHLHPNYAMSLFRKNYAISIVDYITQYRIAHAQRLLVTTDLNVSQIAIESGFGSVSRFYTAFKAACDQSPGEYRASLALP